MKIRKTALALAIASATMSVSATEASLQKYNLSNQPLIQASTADLTAPEAQKVSGWLVKLKENSIVEAKTAGKTGSQIGNINKSQASMIADLHKLDANIEVVAQTRNLVNGIIVKTRANLADLLANNNNVDKVLPIFDYDLDVAASATYMNATEIVANNTATGKNVKVAVLDTGVDYTHKALGGPGTRAAYDAAAADPADTPAWPQGNVVGGFDFVNNDPDPLDITENHGTHVSHSVVGLAPDAELYVYSVCEATCSGINQLRALEASMDPNNDGDLSDRVDVINMSLGGDFGTTRGGAVQELLDKAALLGVNAAISAGNDGPTPFIVGGPSTSANVMSVGAMTHPTTPIDRLTGTFGTNTVDIGLASYNPAAAFSFSNTSHTLVYPTDNQNGCEAFADGVDFTNQIVIIDRGACAFTSKTLNAQAKGAAAVIIVDNVDRDVSDFVGGSASGITIPTISMTLASGNAVKAALAADAALTFNFNSEAEKVAVPDAIATFTSRGPNVNGLLKPEITAPGTDILTAQPGLGDGLTPISGTSFSSPMTAGAMALLKEALPNRNAIELKATLMNSANLDVKLAPESINPDAGLAPISFIGAGLVDVQKASQLPVAAWDKDSLQGALSFGLVAVTETKSVTKRIVVKNFSSTTQQYSLAIADRFANDTATGAVSFKHPENITIAPGATTEFDVTITIDGSKLHDWTLTQAQLQTPRGSTALTAVEYDGALEFSNSDGKAFHLVYHVLPKANSGLEIAVSNNSGRVSVTANNKGSVDERPIVVPITGEDPAGDSTYLDLTMGSMEVLAVPTSVCDSGRSVFATLTFAETIASDNVAGFYVDYDLNSDGNFDFSAQTLARSAFGGGFPAGLNVTFTSAWNTFSGSLENVFFTPGSNFVTLQHCVDSIGLDADDLGQMNATIRFRVETSQFDFYEETGEDTLTVTGYNFAPTTVLARLSDTEGNAVTTIPAGGSANVTLSGADFAVLSGSGAPVTSAKPSADSNVAPVVTADQKFSVDENTANGTVVGKIEATDADVFSSVLSEIVVVSSNLAALSVDRDGTIKVADATLLNFEGGTTEIVLEVVAADSSLNLSQPTTVTVSINNLPDTAAEQPAPPAPASSGSSGGSFGWLLGAFLPLAWLRRRMK
ncbi:S8 family serine peptidase [Endozoicomonas sp. G2_1]|uniref:S8 family serine peptidase n=1 Tax=Endozoicomonas sp. G2_1 TaxID=2821091 RepID=UPI001ADC764A|nr:S8 family serine peptidase [Endozoicomonas sp. G2_1]MBO9491894.1 S8 family serine peptidase [Endozoicomonas sp. G2_1]